MRAKPNAVIPARFDAQRAILDDRATVWTDAEAPRGMQEQVGRRLAARDVLGAEDAALEPREQSRRLQREPDALVRAAGGDAGRSREQCQHLGHAGHGGQLPAEGLEQALVVAVLEIRGERACQTRLGDLAHARERAAHVLRDAPLARGW